MNCVAHQSSGLWRHPDDQAWRYTDIEYWTNLARIAERGLFDSIFIADVLGTYDVFGGNDVAAIRNGAQVPVNDPVQLAAVMAAVTEHVGFGITAGTAFEHPVPFARRLSTLDHLTKGRVGWNVVTGYLPSAARNLGQADQLEHDQRYDHADEYLEVVYKLLEGSWEDDAVVRDRERGVFAEPDKVHHIGHHGTHFTVPGIHLSEPSPQRTPLVFQAGASPRGIRFAARHAEAIFIASPTNAVARKSVDAIRSGLVEAGRSPDAAKIYLLLTIIVDETDELAQKKHEEYLSYVSPEGALTFLSGWMGVDLSKYDLDEPLGNVESNAIQSTVAAFQADNPDGRAWTVRDMVERNGIAGLGATVVGSAATVADEMERIIAETGVDGFNLAYAVTPGTFEDVVEHVVPELQRRGVYPTEYAPGTLRDKLFGAGDRLPDDHRGAGYRVGAPLSTIDDSIRDGAPATTRRRAEALRR
ncbi:LLM class flavin-dependent oxidoreductase [Leucobacter triazinivorans]|uniref:LLM class flavin-dependent oxidoreductase n=1 Tax=Leucobacter triazinivorans TaxID=1784719 RepID=A0A4P6KL72_9MICO|nr:LLM class flavin-dependent oxidoreductase [Leucobacter triazinivorans]QBE50394.1 LLM class flavin-dependent oxidoreductase [Leucobacter triazinivorans]